MEDIGTKRLGKIVNHNSNIDPVPFILDNELNSNQTTIKLNLLNSEIKNNKPM